MTSSVPLPARDRGGSTEFLGSNEERGWKLAGDAVPVLYVAWSVWLIAPRHRPGDLK
jgi:hypothetical protein